MIGGNTKAQLQIKTTTKNAIGESVKSWNTVQELTGFLDLQSGNSNYQTYNAKIQESTHIFICDYVPIDNQVNAENARMFINSQRYDVMMIDNPMELNKHLEIYLKFTGGQ